MASRVGVISAADAVWRSRRSGPSAQETYKIGVLGRADRLCRGQRPRLARRPASSPPRSLNAKGGLLGKKIEIIVEDNRSEPQEAVVGYRKMMSNDKVNDLRQRLRLGRQFRRGRLRGPRRDPDGAVLDPAAAAGGAEMGLQRAAAAALRGRERATATSRRRPRSARSASCTTRRPTRMLTKDVGAKIAQEFGLEVVATETYKPDDADSACRSAASTRAGAGAIIKMGQGGSTVTVGEEHQAARPRQADPDGEPRRRRDVPAGRRREFWATASCSSRRACRCPRRSRPGRPARPPSAFLKVWREKHGDRDPDTPAPAPGIR